MAIEILEDIKGAVHLEPFHGERFRGWYLFKTALRKEWVWLNYKDKKYEFTVCDFNFRFVMPSKIEFADGLISYSEGERLLGVFRFPRDKHGKFCAPICLDQKKLDEMIEESKKDIEEMLSMKPPLVFEAFRIPQYGFELPDLDSQATERISELTDIDYVGSLKKEHEKIIAQKTEEIKAKILSIPNYLLILRNVLDRHWKDFDEVSRMTDKIIHI